MLSLQAHANSVGFRLRDVHVDVEISRLDILGVRLRYNPPISQASSMLRAWVVLVRAGFYFWTNCSDCGAS